MKKGLKVLSTSLLLASLVFAGCSCKKDDTKTNVSKISNGSAAVAQVGDKAIRSYKLSDFYDALIADDYGNKAVANKLVEFVASEVLEIGVEGSPWTSRYDELVKEALKEMAESESYLVKGVFSEEFMASSLRAEGYNIPACSEYGTVEELKCDYIDVVNKNIKISALSTLLQQKYIQEVSLKDRANLLTTKKIRDVEYFTVSSSLDSTYTDFSARDFMRTLRSQIAAGEVTDLSTVEATLKAQLIEIVTKERDKIGTSEDYSKAIVTKYTNNYTQSVQDGYDAKVKEINDVEYYFSKLISSDSASDAVISGEITKTLLAINDVTATQFSRNLIKVGDDYYLVNSNAGANVDVNDILLSSTTDATTYTYSVVKFRIINSSTTDESDLYSAVKLLSEESTLGSGALVHYLKEYKSKINVYDDAVKTYLATLYPEIFAE